MNFKVKILTVCEIHNKPIPKGFRTYCSKQCRTLALSRRHYKQSQAWQSRKRGEYQEGKIQCLLCPNWYVQIGSHVQYAHKLLAKEYKEFFDLPLKRGVIPEWYQKIKSDIAKGNGTAYLLPKAGMRTRYKKGDPRAKEVTGWKGRTGSIGYKGYEK